MTVIYAFLLLAIIIILPIIPAYILHRFLKGNKVAASGVLANIKFSATGPVATYILVILLSHDTVSYLKEIIMDDISPTWTISSKVVFFDKDGNPITNGLDDMVKITKIDTDPSMYKCRTKDLYKFCVTGKRKNITVIYDRPNFETHTISLDTLNDNAIDEANKKINLGTINLYASQDTEGNTPNPNIIQAVNIGPQ